MLQLGHITLTRDQISVADFSAADGFPIALEGLATDAYVAALFVHSARLYPFAPAYLQAQLSELLGPARQSQLNTLARSCALLAKHRQDPQRTVQVLARLSLHPHFSLSAESISRALLNQAYLRGQRKDVSPEPIEHSNDTQLHQLPFPIHADVKPIPAALTRALLQWPDDDRLFLQALQLLQQQPALSSLVCRYATAYTPQGSRLELKPSLLLIGPERSRELVLLAHFESNLSKPVFPLRGPLLQRRMLIQHCLQRLSETYNVALPCRSELLAYLLIYDAWRSQRWTRAVKLNPRPSQPWVLQHWLENRTPTTEHRVALRLCQYWKMPPGVSQALRRQHSDPAVNALIALSMASACMLSMGADIHTPNAENQLHRLFDPWFLLLPSSEPSSTALQRYLETVRSAATDAHYVSDLPWTMRP